jgi:outer membrane immunogenic protein
MGRLSVAWIAAVSAVALTQAAFAADIPTKAPIYKAPVAAPEYNWTGFYVGVNAGGSIGRDPTTQSISNGIGSATVGTFTMSPAGFIGGGQIGYNYQFARHWVVGVEGDFQGASQKDSSCVLSCNGTVSTFTIDDTQKIKWFATARARFGYTGSPFLWYVTGGAAWAQVQNDLTVFVNLVDGSGSANFNQSGWTIGGGVETSLGGNWTAKLEYLYLDFGSFTDVAFQGPFTFTSKSDIRDHIVRVGLNYKLANVGDMGAPVYAASPAPASAWNWTGFYVGVNAGGSIGRDPTTQARSNGITTTTFGTFTMSPAGFIGGGQIGYNYQFAPHWVVGVEGDFQGASQTDSSCVGGCDAPASFTATDTQKVNWFATARARFGYTGSPFLWYVTGGAAWGEVHNEFFVNRQAPASANFNQSGWTIGGGVETHLGGNWTAKLEYLYLDLGSFTDVTYTSPPNLVWTSTSEVRDHIVRVGLNYKFN